ncbi:hypothetical protein GCM10029978_055540 [Actinoallomurus acanthiterrae]
MDMTSPDPAVGRVLATLPGPGSYMCGLTWDGERLWHSDQEAGSIFAVDPSDGTLTRRIDCPHVRADLAYDGRLLCQVGGRPKRLVLIDPETGEVTGEKAVLPSSGRLTGAEFGPEGVWLYLRDPTVVQLRDYATMTVQREFPALGEAPSGLTYADGVIVYASFDAMLYAMDPETGAHLGRTAVVGHPTGLTWDGRRLWYCDFAERGFRAMDLAAVRG